jgi:hypothetical protein
VNERVPDASERLFQDAVIQVATMNQWLVHHSEPGRYGHSTFTSGLAGYPDLTLVSKRQDGIIYAELKTAVGRLSDKQKHVLAMLHANGAEVYVWRPADMDFIVERLGRWRKH